MHLPFSRFFFFSLTAILIRLTVYLRNSNAITQLKDVGTELLLNSVGVMGIYSYCDSFPVEPLRTKPFTCLWEFMPYLNPDWFKISRGNFCLLCSFSEHLPQRAMGLCSGAADSGACC